MQFELSSDEYKLLMNVLQDVRERLEVRRYHAEKQGDIFNANRLNDELEPLNELFLKLYSSKP